MRHPIANQSPTNHKSVLGITEQSQPDNAPLAKQSQVCNCQKVHKFGDSDHKVLAVVKAGVVINQPQTGCSAYVTGRIDIDFIHGDIQDRSCKK